MPAILKIPGATITGVPVPPKDERLTTGSLLLVDPTHPGGSAWSGSPTAGETIPNIADAQALATIGAPVDEVTLFNTAADPTHAKIEVTSAGSLHFTTSVTVDVFDERVGIQIPNSLRQYLFANTGHDLYVGMGVQMTRVASGGQTVGYLGGIFQSPNFGADAQASIGVLDTGAMAASPGSSDPDRIGFTATSGSNGNQFAAITAAKLDLTFDATSYVVAAGPYHGPSVNAAPSFVLRSIYIEDLTVSGRSHAMVAALDEQAFQSAASGRWSGDTATALA